MIYYSLKQAPKGEVTIEILDASGSVIRKYSSNDTELDEPLGPDDKKPENQIKAEAGLNRFLGTCATKAQATCPTTICGNTKTERWDRWSYPGKYQVRLTADGKSQTHPWT